MRKTHEQPHRLNEMLNGPLPTDLPGLSSPSSATVAMTSAVVVAYGFTGAAGRNKVTASGCNRRSGAAFQNMSRPNPPNKKNAKPGVQQSLVCRFDMIHAASCVQVESPRHWSRLGSQNVEQRSQRQRYQLITALANILFANDFDLGGRARIDLQSETVKL